MRPVALPSRHISIRPVDKLRSNCQSRKFLSNMNQDSVIAHFTPQIYSETYFGAPFGINTGSFVTRRPISRAYMHHWALNCVFFRSSESLWSAPNTPQIKKIVERQDQAAFAQLYYIWIHSLSLVVPKQWLTPAKKMCHLRTMLSLCLSPLFRESLLPRVVIIRCCDWKIFLSNRREEAAYCAEFL